MGASKFIKSSRIYTGQAGPFSGYVEFCGSTICSVSATSPADGVQVIDVGDNRVIPGLIDLHIHGSMGKNCCTSDPQDLKDLSRYLAENGTTSFQPSVGASPVPDIESSIAVARDASRGPVTGARSLGIHLEGPFLNVKKKGAMRAECIIPPSMELARRWMQIGEGTIRQMTIAPEMPGALEVIRYLSGEGVTMSVGHTEATYEQIMDGFRAGITVATHTYNAMRELHHRDPGVLGAALTTKGIFCELICDTIHVHPAAMSLVFLAKGTDYVSIITDAVQPAGLPPGVYHFQGRDVTVEASGRTFLPGGTIAGSTTVTRKCVRNVVEKCGIPFESALAMATVNPAKVAGVWGRKGSLAPGKDADIAVLDDNYDVVWSFVEGEALKRGDNS